MSELIKVPPLKPYEKGSLSTKEFGGPATSPLDVLQRTRVALSPRGAWNTSGWQKTTKQGHARCIRQCFKDVDGVHVAEAETIMIKAIKDLHGKKYTSIETFNDDKNIHKHQVLAAVDRAIEIAS